MIVSRKFTQLSEVKNSTAIKYLNELAKKYPENMEIPATPKNIREGIAGRSLEGPQILEVPVQHGKVPQVVVDHANALSIKIRDVNGKEYN